jgi:hypothetical protein
LEEKDISFARDRTKLSLNPTTKSVAFAELAALY